MFLPSELCTERTIAATEYELEEFINFWFLSKIQYLATGNDVTDDPQVVAQVDGTFG